METKDVVVKTEHKPGGMSLRTLVSYRYMGIRLRFKTSSKLARDAS